VSARTRCCARWPDASGTWRGSRVAAGDRRVFRAAMLHPDESMPSWRPKLTHHGCPSDRIAPTRASSLIPKARAPIAIPAAAMSDPHRRALSLVARNHMNSKCADCRSKGQGRIARTRALNSDGHWALLELMSLDVVLSLVPAPTHASYTLGIFLCQACAECHQRLPDQMRCVDDRNGPVACSFHRADPV
jgi:hypothetical protein